MGERLLVVRQRPEGQSLVFLSPTLEPLYGSHVTERVFKPLVEKAGLRPCRFHDLRHCYASLLLSRGARIDLVAKRLGHRDPTTTLRVYSHLLPGDEAEMVARVEDVLFAG